MEFPQKAATDLIRWMHGQMYETHTEWTYGNEHDQMLAAYDLLCCLKEHYTRRVKVTPRRVKGGKV